MNQTFDQRQQAAHHGPHGYASGQLLLAPQQHQQADHHGPQALHCSKHLVALPHFWQPA